MSAVSAASTARIHPFLQYHTLHDLLKAKAHNKSLCTVQSNLSVHEVLQYMKEKDIISCPVLEGTECIGIVNVVDLVIPLVYNEVWNAFEEEDVGSTKDWNKVISFLKEKEHKIMRVFDAPVSQFLGVSRESQTLWKYHESTSLFDIMPLFSAGGHRILVYSDDEHHVESMHFVSQWDILQFVAAHSNLFENVLDKTIAQLHLLPSAQSPLVFTTSDKLAYQGLRHLHQWSKGEITALPILDDKTSQLLATLSASDIRRVDRNNWYTLATPVLDYVGAASIERTRLQAMYFQTTCVSADTLQNVVNALLRARVHRCWLVNKGFQCGGVISLTDCIRTLVYDHSADSVA